MANIELVLTLEERTALGKGLNVLRQQGLVPAVIHDHGKASVHVQAKREELEKAYRQAGKNHPLELKVGAKQYLALIKEASYKPPKHRLQHLVFQAVKQDEEVEAEVPVRIDGDMPAERVGLVVLRQLDSVSVSALPRNLPDELVIDGARLSELHDKVTVADLSAPANVTILTEPEHAIATVVEPRSMAAEEEVEPAEGEGEEGEEGETTDESAQTAKEE